MNKPQILLSGKAKLQNYVDAVNLSGAIADGKYLPEISAEYDGLLICGGSDVHPKYYNEKIDGSVGIDLDRDVVEFALMKAFVEAKKPIFGICRGFQLINIYFGGSLYQDMEDSSAHSASSDTDLVHSVKSTEGSFLEKMYGRKFSVNSHHHQKLKALGEGLQISALTEDNSVIEAIEHISLPIFGVQWHPERMCYKCSREDTVDGAYLFDYFIEKCKN